MYLWSPATLLGLKGTSCVSFHLALNLKQHLSCLSLSRFMLTPHAFLALQVDSKNTENSRNMCFISGPTSNALKIVCKFKSFLIFTDYKDHLWSKAHIHNLLKLTNDPALSVCLSVCASFQSSAFGSWWGFSVLTQVFYGWRKLALLTPPPTSPYAPFHQNR